MTGFQSDEVMFAKTLLFHVAGWRGFVLSSLLPVDADELCWRAEKLGLRPARRVCRSTGRSSHESSRHGCASVRGDLAANCIAFSGIRTTYLLYAEGAAIV